MLVNAHQCTLIYNSANELSAPSSLFNVVGSFSNSDPPYIHSATPLVALPLSCGCKVIGHWHGYIAKRENIPHLLFQLEGIITLIICDIAIEFM
jgi:hypothetical protein